MCIWLYLLLKKYCRVEFLIGFLLQLLKANDFDRDGCRKFIVQFPWWKMKTFLFARVIAEKLLLARPWGGEYCISFPTQAVLRRSLNLSWTIFLTCFNPWINNFCSATFIFQLSHSPYFKSSSINNISYWL